MESKEDKKSPSESGLEREKPSAEDVWCWSFASLFSDDSESDIALPPLLENKKSPSESGLEREKPGETCTTEEEKRSWSPKNQYSVSTTDESNEQDEKAPSESWVDENVESFTEEDEEEQRELFTEEEDEEIAVADESDSAEQLYQREKKGQQGIAFLFYLLESRKKAQETPKQNTTPHTNGEMSSDAAHVFTKRIVRIFLEEQAAEGSFVPQGCQDFGPQTCGTTTSLEFLERLTQKITQEVNQFVRALFSHESQRTPEKEQTPHIAPVSRNESSLSAEDIERPKKRVRHVERSSQPSVIIDFE